MFRLPTLALLSCLLVPTLAAAQDAGGADAGVADAGSGDAGVSDAGADTDAGPNTDAGVSHDAGAAGDAGMSHDAGAAGDAGTIADAGVSADAGVESDAGPQPGCDITCTGDVLTFCDGATGETIEIDCALLEGRCGLLSAEWGNDCILPEGAACEPGYANGQSRCEPLLYCNTNECSTEVPAPVADLIAPSSAGGIGSVGVGDESPFACLNCNESVPFDIPFVGLLMGLGLQSLRRRRKNRRASFPVR